MADALDINLSVQDIQEMDPAMVASMYAKVQESRRDMLHDLSAARVDLEKWREHSAETNGMLADAMRDLREKNKAMADLLVLLVNTGKVNVS